MARDLEWKTKRPDGSSYTVRVSRFAKKFTFQFLDSETKRWDYTRNPTLEDLDELVAQLERRYRRRQATDEEVRLAHRLRHETQLKS